MITIISPANAGRRASFSAPSLGVAEDIVYAITLFYLLANGSPHFNHFFQTTSDVHELEEGYNTTFEAAATHRAAPSTEVSMPFPILDVPAPVFEGVSERHDLEEGFNTSTFEVAATYKVASFTTQLAERGEHEDCH